MFVGHIRGQKRSAELSALTEYCAHLRLIIHPGLLRGVSVRRALQPQLCWRIFLGSLCVISWLAGLLIPATALRPSSPPFLAPFPCVLPALCPAPGQLKPPHDHSSGFKLNRCILKAGQGLREREGGAGREEGGVTPAGPGYFWPPVSGCECPLRPEIHLKSLQCALKVS